MKKPNSIALIAEIPTELSREEVASILKKLPDLPPPPSSIHAWWKAFSHYSILAIGMIGLCLCVWFWESPESRISSAEPQLSERMESNVLEEHSTKENVQSEPEQSNSIPPTLTMDNQADRKNPPEIEENVWDQKEEESLAPVYPQTEGVSHQSVDPLEASIDTDSALDKMTKNKENDIIKSRPQIRGTQGSSSYTLVDPFFSKEDRFADVPLRKLRRIVRIKLVKDGLIKTRRDTIDIWLPRKEGLLYLNGKEMNPEESLNYGVLCDQFGVGFGPYRHVKITYEGIAVGDFTPEGFSGAAQGTFKLDFRDKPNKEGVFNH